MRLFSPYSTYFGLLLGSCLSITQLVAQTPTDASAGATVGQILTLDGSALKVSYGQQLARGVDFYTMKSTTNLKAAPINYLRTNNAYSRTVFTQQQYETFIKTGKMSAFGTVKKYVTPSGSTGNYVAVGTTEAYLIADGKDLFMNEVTVTSRELTPAEQIYVRDCKAACDGGMKDCRRQGNADILEGEGDGMLRECDKLLESCTNKCYTDVLTKIRLSYHALSAAVTVNPK